MSHDRKGPLHGQDPHHRRPGKRRRRAARTAISTSSCRRPGSARIGTNPEQLFAAGWSACFESAIGARGPQKERSRCRPISRSTPKWT